MLEKTDLQQIRAIVREEIQEQTLPIIEKSLVPIKKSLNRLEVESRKTRKDINMIIGVFDIKDKELETRIERLETKVGIVN